MPPRPVARELVHIIQKVCDEACADDPKICAEACADGQKAHRGGTCADSLRAIEERQSKEVEYFLRSCGVRLRHAVL